MKEHPTVWSTLRPWTLPPRWFKEKKKKISVLTRLSSLLSWQLPSCSSATSQATRLGPTELSWSAKLMAGMDWVMHKPQIFPSVVRLHSAGDGWRRCESQWMSLKSRLLLWMVWDREDSTTVTQLLTVTWHAPPSHLPFNTVVLAVVVFSNYFPISLFSSSFSPLIFCYAFAAAHFCYLCLDNVFSKFPFPCLFQPQLPRLN